IVLDDDDELEQVDLRHGRHDGPLALAKPRTVHGDDAVQPPHTPIGDDDATNGGNDALQGARYRRSDGYRAQEAMLGSKSRQDRMIHRVAPMGDATDFSCLAGAIAHVEA